LAHRRITARRVCHLEAAVQVFNYKFACACVV